MIRWNLEVRRWNDSPAKNAAGESSGVALDSHSRKLMGRWNPPVFCWNLIPAKNEPLESHPVRDFKFINTEGVGAGRGGECQAEG